MMLRRGGRRPGAEPGCQQDGQQGRGPSRGSVGIADARVLHASWDRYIVCVMPWYHNINNSSYEACDGMNKLHTHMN